MELPDGWFDDKDIEVYRELYSALPLGSKTAELGTWKGKSLCSVADIIDDRSIEVVAVDTFKGTQTEKEAWAFKDALTQDIQAGFVEELKKRHIENLVRVLAMTTLEAATKVPDDEFDFIFIDADHAYESVKADIQAWLPKVKSGGILAGDDYTFGSVSSAVHELLGRDNIEQKASIWIYRKK